MSVGDLVVDPAQPTSVFAQLKTFLLNEIVNGSIGPNEQLPTEYELCIRFHISRTPVHRALAELAAEGVVTRHRRRGTFVNPAWVEKNVRAHRLDIVLPVGPWQELIADATPENVSVNPIVVELPALHDYLMDAVANGTAPDLAVLDSVWVAEFASAGMLRPIDELDEKWTAGEYRREFASTFVNSHTIDDSIVAVQAEADVAGLWYDRTALAAHGLSVPATWQELREACQLLQKASGRKALAFSSGPAAGEAASYTLLALLASNGVTVIDGDEVTLDTSAAVHALEFIRHLATDGSVATAGGDFPRERPIEMLAAGEVVFAFGGSYALPALTESLNVSAEEAWSRFGFAPMPHGPSARHTTLAGGMAFAVFRQSEHPEVAMRLLESMVGRDSQARMARLTGQIPSRITAIDEFTGDGSLLDVSSRMLDGAVVRPPVSSYDRISHQLQLMFADVVLGRISPIEACRHTAILVAAITGLQLNAA